MTGTWSVKSNQTHIKKQDKWGTEKIDPSDCKPNKFLHYLGGIWDYGPNAIQSRLKTWVIFSEIMVRLLGLAKSECSNYGNQFVAKPKQGVRHSNSLAKAPNMPATCHTRLPGLQYVPSYSHVLTLIEKQQSYSYLKLHLNFQKHIRTQVFSLDRLLVKCLYLRDTHQSG